MSSAKAQEALNKIRKWEGGNEIDLYPYIKDLFVDVFGYPKESVKLNTTQREGFPDIILLSKDSTPQMQVPWVCAEVKRERGLFRSTEGRKDAIETRLKKYVTAHTVYGLLIEPLTIGIYLPDCREIRIIKLDEIQASNLTDSNDANNLNFLSYENSVSEKALETFRNGETPTGYLSIATREERERLHDALRVCARELMDYASAKLKEERTQYANFAKELAALGTQGENQAKTSFQLRQARLKIKYKKAIHVVDYILPEFEKQLGKQTPPDPEKAANYIADVFATEAASLVLSRIIFIRFAEDHHLTTRKISNGGISAFSRLITYTKEEYQWLLRLAYADASHIYARLFEDSIFDWAHEGNGQLAKILERVFYRLNAFNFELITGDVLGNIYEAFLDKKRRKKVGEYYTKPEIVNFILGALRFSNEPSSILDPACGSGSFLVQALSVSTERMVSQGVAPKVAIESTLELIHGLDINVFASFITQLQILWNIFGYIETFAKHQLPELKVYGGLNSLEYDPQLTLGEAVTMPLEQEATLVRDSKYRMVVGNPPYIRNERLRDKGEWRGYYSTVDKRNSDIAFYFVQRALLGGTRKTDTGEDSMPPWLEEKGKLGFVLSIGFANSRAALALRQSMLSFKILHLVDLELVAYRLFDADIVPMLIVIQREPAPPDWEVEVRVVDPSHKDDRGNIQIEKAQPYKLRQSLLAVNDVNPFGYFLTNLRDDDVPILSRLFSIQKTVSDYGLPISAPTKPSKKKESENDEEELTNVALLFGMKLGSGTKIKETETTGAFKILKGSDVSTYLVDDTASEGWIHPDDVESKSVWGYLDKLHDVAYVLPCIVVAPVAARFNPKNIAFNNSTIIFVPNNDCKDFPWETYFNSSLVRFIHHVSLRTTILLRRRCTLYGRTVERFPVADQLLERKRELTIIANELRTLAPKIKQRWILVDQAIESSEKKRLSAFGLDFTTWSGTASGNPVLTEIAERPSLTLVDDEGTRSLFYIQAPIPLLKMIEYLLTQNEEDEDELEVSATNLQMLEIPTNYEELAKMIDDAKNPDSPDILRFKELMSLADKIIEKAFGLTPTDSAYIRKRLDTYPISTFEPRLPWTIGAHHQKTRIYVPDKRFA